MDLLDDLGRLHGKLKSMELEAPQSDQMSDEELSAVTNLLESMLSSCRFIDFLQKRRMIRG
jgi:hypothetical protein